MRFVTLPLVLGVMLAGCAATPKDVVATGERYTAAPEGVEDYRLSAGDKVRVAVFNEPTLSGEFAVSTDGFLSLPLVGNMQVLGMSADAVQTQVQSKLADGYLRDPKVNVEIISYRPFYVAGEVEGPGQFPYSSGMTAMNAVALAKGFTPRAEKSVIYIRRAGSTQEVAYRLTPDLRVWPGDTIRVTEKYF
jgi:polysaccharide export outer membrane protein